MLEMSNVGWEEFVNDVANELVVDESRARVNDLVASSVRDRAAVAICGDGSIKSVARNTLSLPPTACRAFARTGLSDCCIDGVPVPTTDIVASGRQCVVPLDWCSVCLDDVVVVQLPPLEPPFQRTTYGWFAKSRTLSPSQVHRNMIRLLERTDPASAEWMRRRPIRRRRWYELTSLPISDVEGLVRASFNDGIADLDDFIDRRFHRLALKPRRDVIDEHQEVLSRLEAYNATRICRMVAAVKSAPSRATRKRRRVAPDASALEARAATCVVCLESKACVTSRCKGSRCRSATCDDCNQRTRGLCVICDRDLLHAHYVCMGCYDVHSLETYGHACVSCEDHRLCRTCWQQFGDCWDCRASAAKAEREPSTLVTHW